LQKPHQREESYTGCMTNRDQGKRELVLVTGAGGLIGQSVVRNLSSKGYRVRAGIHTYRKGSMPVGSEQYSIDLCDAESIDQAVAGMDFVIHLAARKSDEADSRAVNVDGAKNLVAACKKHGVKLLINVSTQSVKFKRRGLYGQTKAEAEDIIRSSGLAVITLQPSIVYSSLDTGIFGSIRSFLRLPILPVIGSGEAHYSPIHSDDLAEMIERIARDPQAIGRTLEVGGPDRLTMNEVISMVSKHVGIRRPIIHLPEWLCMLIAHTTSWMPRPPITVSNVLGAIQDLPIDTETIQTMTGFRPRRLIDVISSLDDQTTWQAQGTSQILLRYVLHGIGIHNEPSPDMIDRFEDACRKHDITLTSLSDSLKKHQWLLRSIDSISKLMAPRCMLQQSLLIASAIVECDPISAEALLPRDRSKIGAVTDLLGIGIQWVLSLLIGFFVYIFYSSFMKKNGAC
jgi:nucleoside-diphosphate-sugar epimerase